MTVSNCEQHFKFYGDTWQLYNKSMSYERCFSPQMTKTAVFSATVWFGQVYLKPWSIYIILLLNTRSKKNRIEDKVSSQIIRMDTEYSEHSIFHKEILLHDLSRRPSRYYSFLSDKTLRGGAVV